MEFRQRPGDMPAEVSPEEQQAAKEIFENGVFTVYADNQGSVEVFGEGVNYIPLAPEDPNDPTEVSIMLRDHDSESSLLDVCVMLVTPQETTTDASFYYTTPGNPVRRLDLPDVQVAEFRALVDGVEVFKNDIGLESRVGMNNIIVSQKEVEDLKTYLESMRSSYDV